MAHTAHASTIYIEQGISCNLVNTDDMCQTLSKTNWPKAFVWIKYKGYTILFDTKSYKYNVDVYFRSITIITNMAIKMAKIQVEPKMTAPLLAGNCPLVIAICVWK